MMNEEGRNKFEGIAEEVKRACSALTIEKVDTPAEPDQGSDLADFRTIASIV